jgi:flagellar biosynthesis protein FlhA
MQQQQAPLLVTSPLTRPHIKRVTESYIPQLVVLSHNDIVANVRIRNLGVVKV